MAASMRAQRRYLGPFYSERSPVIPVPRLADERAQPGVPGELLGTAEPGDVPELGGDRVPENPGDARRGHQERDIRVVRAGCLQVGRAPVDLGVEFVDHSETGGKRGGPWLGDRKAREQLSALRPEEVGHRHGMTEGDQGGVDPVLEGGPVAHEVEPEAGPLPLGPDGRVGQL